MAIYITADLHFQHTNILKFCPDTRKFKDVDHMNAMLMKEWNSTISPNDTVYILGDLSFGTVDKAIEIVKQLNGHKILIEGNHDEKFLRDARFAMLFSKVEKLHDFKYNGTRVVMCHYPIWEWRDMHKGAVMFYGHVHGKETGIGGRSLDVGYDAHGRILTFDEAFNMAMKGEIRGHH